MTKFVHGAWLPLAVGIVVFTLDEDNLTYFLSTVELRRGDKGGMSRWRKHLFLATSRITADAAERFRLPREPGYHRGPRRLQMESSTPGRSTTLKEVVLALAPTKGRVSGLNRGLALLGGSTLWHELWGAVLGTGQSAWAAVRASRLLGQKRRAQSAT